MILNFNSLINNAIQKNNTKINVNKSIFATVTGINESGTVLLRFDGEKTSSEKQYQRLAGYAPSIGDRVLLMRHNGTVLVVDKVVGIPAPFPKPEPDPPTTEEKLIKISESVPRINIEKLTISSSVDAGVEALLMSNNEKAYAEIVPKIKIESSACRYLDITESAGAELIV